MLLQKKVAFKKQISPVPKQKTISKKYCISSRVIFHFSRLFTTVKKKVTNYIQEEKQLQDLYNFEEELCEIVKGQLSQELQVLEGYSGIIFALGNADTTQLQMKTHLNI